MGFQGTSILGKATSFSSEQAAIIVGSDTDACIVAPAGSGKTSTTAGRVAYLIKKMEVAPAGIACITYTDAAAETLRERIANLVAEKCGAVLGLAELSVTTFHSFALDLLRRHVTKYATVGVLTEAQRRLFAHKHFDTIGIGSVERIVRRGKGAKRILLTEEPNDIRVFLQAVDLIREENLDLRLLPSGLCAAYIAYLHLLHQNRCLDFAHILVTFFDALCHSTDHDSIALQQHIVKNLKHVLVDEFQDCAPLQTRTLSRLHELDVRLTVIGDPRQSIYGFRGGAPTVFSDFKRRYPSAGFYALSKNRRSSHGVVDAVLCLVPDMGQEVASLVDTLGAGAMVAASHNCWERGDMAALTLPSVVAQDAWGAERLKAMQGSFFVDRQGETARGITWGDMAVLVRRKETAHRIANVLRAANIPCFVSGNENLLESPEAGAITTAYEFLANKVDEATVTAAFLNANIGLESADVERGVAYLTDVRNKAMRPANDEGTANTPVCLIKTLYELLGEMQWHDARVKFDKAAGGNGRRNAVMCNIARIARATKDYQTIYYRLLPTTHKFADFAFWLRHQAPVDYADSDSSIGQVVPDAVCITTVHNAKGAEWPLVWLPDASEGEFPARSWKGRAAVWQLLNPQTMRVHKPSRFDGTDEEEARLFAVGVTRAKKWLFITAPLLLPKNNQLLPPARFLSRLSSHPAFVSAPNVLPPAADAAKKLPPRPAVSDDRQRVTVTFSELFTYFSCPKQYQLRTSWGFPPPATEALGHPEALHAAIAEYHLRAAAGEKTFDGAELEAMIERHHHTPYADESLKARLRASAVRKLKSYVAAYTTGDVAAVEAVEQAIAVEASGIKVTGRLDIASRDESNRPVVDDLKTSAAAIRRDRELLVARGYALGWQSIIGTLPTRIGTREIGAPVETGYHSMEMDEVIAEDMVLRIEEAGRAIQLNVLPVRPANGNQTCRTCDPHSLCWRWQRK